MVIDDNDLNDFDDSNDCDDSDFGTDCDNARIYCFLMTIDDDQDDTYTDEFDSNDYCDYGNDD